MTSAGEPPGRLPKQAWRETASTYTALRAPWVKPPGPPVDGRATRWDQRLDQCPQFVTDQPRRRGRRRRRHDADSAPIYLSSTEPEDLLPQRLLSGPLWD